MSGMFGGSFGAMLKVFSEVFRGGDTRESYRKNTYCEMIIHLFMS